MCGRLSAVLIVGLSAVLIVGLVIGLFVAAAPAGASTPGPPARLAPLPRDDAPTASAPPTPTHSATPSPCDDCVSESPTPGTGPTSAPATSAPTVEPAPTPTRPASTPHQARVVRPRVPAFSPVPLANPLPLGAVTGRGAGRGAPRLEVAAPVARTGLGALDVVVPRVHRVSPRSLTWTGLGVLAISVCGMVIVGRRRRGW